MLKDKKICSMLGGGYDDKSFVALYNSTYSQLHAFVLRYVKSSEVAEEIVQDAFVRLYFHRSVLDGERSVKAYLFKTAKNILIKEFRRQIKTPLIRDYVDFMSALSVESGTRYDYDKYIKAIGIAKEGLTPRQREIFVMRMEDEKPFKEIASELGISEQVVRNQLTSAMKAIREALKRIL